MLRRIVIILIPALLSTCLTLGMGSADVAWADDDEIEVEPSGDTTGVTDAANIMAALRACPPGGTVELEEGLYYASERIEVGPDKIDPTLPFVLPDETLNIVPGTGFNGTLNIVPGTGFNGTLKGEGKDETIIRAVRNSDTGAGFPRREIYETPYVLPTLLYFYRPENVRVEDLTLQVIDDNPCDPYDNPWGGDDCTAMNHLFLARNGSFTATLKDVKLQGAEGDFLNIWGAGEISTNVGYCAIICGAGGLVNATVKDCDLSYGGDAALEFFANGNGSQAMIKGNTISDSDGGIWLGWNGGDETTVNIMGNTFTNVSTPLDLPGWSEPHGTVVRCGNIADDEPIDDPCPDDDDDDEDDD